MTTATEYEFSVRGRWSGPASEKPAVTGAKFLQTLDALSGIDPFFSGWQFTAFPAGIHGLQAANWSS